MSPRLGVVHSMVLSAIGDEQSPMKAKCVGKYVGSDEWPDVAMDGSPVNMHGQEKESVRES